MSKKLEVRLLAKFEVRYDGKPITISSRPAQSLFAYLILSAGTSHRREKLAGMLWPDSLEETARENLRHALWRLRKALESASSARFLHADDLTISFKQSSEYWLDAAELEKLSENATADELITVLSNYQGELLPGFYDEWVMLERDHQYSVFEHHMARLMSLLQDEQRWLDILDWGERWVKLGQKPEPAYRALMSAHAAKGDMSKVAAIYQRCVKALKEFGVEPSVETRALYEKLKTGTETYQTSPTVLAKDKQEELPKTNLPSPLTSFVGREREIEELKLLLSSARLLTLTGVGGIGKTRLAIQVEHELLGSFRDGIWWVELASVTDQALLPQALAQVLSVRESPGQSLTESLKSFLREKQALLILDNCEHLVLACAQLAEDLLGQCANLKIMTTSREALGIMGEATFQVPPLSSPVPANLTSMQGWNEFESIQLFIERAEAAHPNLRLTQQNAFAVPQICQRLDGIPLAIELAAARVKLLSLEEIAKRLDDRFDLLTHGSRTALPRHQTLRAAIDWSYNLLSESERTLWRRLSVFTGGWTLKAAETVGADDILPQSQVLELLSHLVDKSLAVVEEQNSRTRYRLLETIRQYGEEKLQASGEKDKVQTRHLEFFLQFAEKTDPKLVTNEQKTVLAELDAEYGNLRSALDFALETDPIRALQLSIALDQFWESRGYIREGRNAIERALQQAAGVPRELRAEALRRHAGIADRQGDYVTATASAEESLKLWREIGNKRGIANSLRVLGNAVWVQGDYVAAKIYHEECIAILREIGDKRGIASTLNNLGNVVVRTGDYAAARRFEEESVALFRELGDHLSLAMALNNLGVVAEEEDDKDDARRYYEESISISHELGEKTFVVYALNGLAHVLCVQGDLINAWRYYRESLVLSHQIGEKRMIAYCLEGLAKVASRRGRAQNAVRFLGAAHALRQVIGAPLDPAERTELDQDVIATRKQMDDRAFELGWADGRAMSLEKAIEFALKEAE